MLASRIRGGVHPAYRKELASGQPIETAPTPERVDIPLAQHLGVPATAKVARGDEVAPGDLIGEATKLICANVHSPVAGKVRAVVQKPLPGGRLCDYVEIQVDREATDAHIWERQDIDLDKIDQKWVAATLRGAGIVGMGGATFPTDVKFSPPPNASLDTLILNGAECEPYLSCDHRMMVEHAEELLHGMLLADAAFAFSRLVIAIEKNKPDAIAAFNAAIDALGLRNAARTPVEVIGLDVRYPQGAEKVLIKVVTGRTVPAGKLPFEVGVVVSNGQTLFALYEAAYFGKPLVDRVVTVSGEGIERPKNIRALIGTPVADLIQLCGGVDPATTKVIAGGPMTGTALPSLDYVVTKGLSGLLFLTQSEYPSESPCIRCGSCVEVCPMGLMPLKLAAYAKAGKFELAKATNLADCFECGSCAWACPANIQIVSWIKYAKNYIRVKGL
ncbi:MAG: electron transport complex subunit RsxC [Spirochaetaceae bacterium]|nr:MAG: electron transport complex subunit RsxC [Spirochaetaceae bacterium]